MIRLTAAGRSAVESFVMSRVSLRQFCEGVFTFLLLIGVAGSVSAAPGFLNEKEVRKRLEVLSSQPQKSGGPLVCVTSMMSRNVRASKAELEAVVGYVQYAMRDWGVSESASEIEVSKHIKDELEKLENLANFVHQRPNFRDCGLSSAEMMAIQFFSGRGSRYLNRSMDRSSSLPPLPAEELRVVEKISGLMRSGLNKLANFSGRLSRYSETIYVIQETERLRQRPYSVPRFISTAAKPIITYGKSVRLIQSRTCKYIAPLTVHEEENEVICLPGTKFWTVGTMDVQQKDKSTTQYVLQEEAEE